jgi:hypothetical protein
MNDRMKWINRRWQLGWLLLALGLVMAAIGGILPRLMPGLAFNPKLITSLGLLSLGIGISFLARYGPVRQDLRAAQRLTNEAFDERKQLIRARAGNRAYWVSAALAYALLMWQSSIGNGSLPALSADALWFALVGVVLAPFGMYAASMIYDEAHS